MADSLKILFKNEDFLIIDKSAGITVNKSDTTKAGETLQDLIEKEELIDKNDPDSEFLSRVGIVHRLDKETSGLLIVARNSNSFRSLQAEFKERKVKKTYIALAHGKVLPSSGNISVPVGRLPWNRKRFGVLAGGRGAVTEYETLSIYKNPKNNELLTLLKLNPKTGRTHQIRVHLKYINHPIFSDPLYSGRKISRDDRMILPRVFLHAAQISFLDPKTHLEVNFKSDLPKELLELLENLEQTNNNKDMPA